jgi:hypothetical protein
MKKVPTIEDSRNTPANGGGTSRNDGSLQAFKDKHSKNSMGAKDGTEEGKEEVKDEKKEDGVV